MKIGVLETGRPAAALAAQHGSYPDMVADWLGGFSAQVKAYPVMDGTFPGTPQDADLWVITGSKCGAYEDHSWIPPLEKFVRDCHAAKSKMIGICFGHQMIAQAIGGRVVKSDKGWGVGTHSYVADHETLPDPLVLQAFHQDQVVEKPQGSEIIASSAFCEIAGLHYPGFAVTVQGHPEFDAAYARALTENRRGAILTEDEADAALQTIDRPTNRAEFADWLKEWYHGA